MSTALKTGLAAALGLAAVAAVGSLLYQGSASVSTSDRARVDALRRTALRMDSEIKRRALEARFGFTHQYDDLAGSAQTLRRTLDAWSDAMTGSLTHQNTASLRATIATVREAAAEQLEAAERFKSHNSVLKNSLRYLPTALAELQTVAAAGRQARSLKATAAQVVLDTYELSALRGEDQAAALDRTLASLDARTQKLKGKTLAPVIEAAKIVVMHAGVCRREIAATNRLLEGIRASSLIDAMEATDRRYQSMLTVLDRRALAYRLAIYMMTVAFALAFVVVVVWLRKLYQSLEEKVSRRTQALSEAHASLTRLYSSNRLVLENVREGLFTIDFRGRLSPEISAAAIGWFGPPSENETMVEWLGSTSRVFGEYLALGLEALREDVLPIEVSLAQLPVRLDAGERVFQFEYRVIEATGRRGYLLVTIQDISDQLAREEEERQQQQVVELAKRAMRDPTGTVEFIESADDLLDQARHDGSLAVIRRALHTFKGNVGLYGLKGLAAHAHTLEDLVEERRARPTVKDFAPLNGAWRDLRSKVQPFLETSATRLAVTDQDVAVLRDAIRGDQSPEQLLRIVQGWSAEPVEHRFERYANYARNLAQRLGRAEPRVEISANAIRLAQDRFGPFWRECIHVVRNAVDHGLEKPDVRESAGKTRQGLLRFIAAQEGDAVVITIADDGMGIDWPRIIERGRDRAPGADRNRPPVDHLFEDGVSTRATASEISGRGVGLGALKKVVTELGGSIDVQSERGEGTAFRFRLPLTARSGATAAPVTAAAPPIEIQR